MTNDIAPAASNRGTPYLTLADWVATPTDLSSPVMDVAG